MSKINLYNLMLSENNRELLEILKLNDKMKETNLFLTKEDAQTLINNKNAILKDLGRVEVGKTILETLILEFYDSSYIDKETYLQTLEFLTSIFYTYQKELSYRLTDEQIIRYLKTKYNGNCAGSLTLLESYCLEALKEMVEQGTYYEQFN